MARLRTPIEREPAEGLLGRVARPIAKPAPVAPKPAAPQFDPAALASLTAKYAPAVPEPVPEEMASPIPAVAAAQNPWDAALAGYQPRLIGFQNGLGSPMVYSSTSREELQNAYLRGEGSIKASDAYSAALDPSFKTRMSLRDQLLAQADQYQVNYKGKAQNATGNAAEMARLLEAGGVTDLSQLKVVDGKLVNSATGKAFENKYTGREGRFGYSALGDGQTDYKFQADANGNPVFYPQWRSSSSIPSWVQPVLTVASIIPSPIQPFAAAANGTISLANGKPLQAALSFAGAANSAGLFDGVGAAPAGGASSPYSLGNAQLGDVTAPGYLGSANLGNATGLGGTGAGLSASTDIFNGIGGGMAIGSGSALSPSVQLGTPSYDYMTGGTPVTSPNGEGISTGPVNGGTGSGLSATPGAGLTLADPGAAAGLLGGTPPQSIIDQARAAGKTVTDYIKDPANALTVRAAMAAGGALLNTVGGSISGGSSYKDDGYRPTISRGGFQASIPAPGAAPGGPGMAPGGFGSGISLPTTGQANDGLWRYAGNRPGGFMPSLATVAPRPPMGAMPPPQTGLISPPAVANYDPRPTGPLPANVPPMQYGYDDPVPLNRTQLSPEMQRAMSPFLGLLNTSPTRGFF